MSTTEVSSVDYRELMKRVEQVVDAIEQSVDIGDMVHTLAERVITELPGELGIYGGRLYKREGSDYLLQATFGKAKTTVEGVRIASDYPPVEICRTKGLVFMQRDDPRLDRELEDQLGVGEFAAIEVGDEQYLLAFDVAPGHSREDILLSLGILRYSINQKIRQERMEEVFREARKIQASILPRQPPLFGDFNIGGRTESVDKVGGDFYDYIPITDKILGLAIADVSGHGLPAALQVRDIYMGLRMGLARDFKIVRTVERLNGIIHRSTLTSRFVSMFYGELELDGTLIYVNAGHPPPFHLSADGSVGFLDKGGVILGPLPEATYERGYLTLRPGDMLVLYTDGVVETTCDATGEGEEYGVERLVELARANQGKPATEVVDAIFEDVKAFCRVQSFPDDRTVSVVTHPG